MLFRFLLPSFVAAAVIITSCHSPGKIDPGQKPETVQLYYMMYACECAQWADVRDLDKYDDDTLEFLTVYIEPLYDSVRLPDSLGRMGNIVEFTGNFYPDKGYPKGWSTEQPADEARVFRYEAYRVVKLNR